MPLRKYVRFNFEASSSYPKKDTEVPILERKWIKRNGVVGKQKQKFYDGCLNPLFK